METKQSDMPSRPEKTVTEGQRDVVRFEDLKLENFEPTEQKQSTIINLDGKEYKFVYWYKSTGGGPERRIEYFRIEPLGSEDSDNENIELAVTIDRAYKAAIEIRFAHVFVSRNELKDESGVVRRVFFKEAPMLFYGKISRYFQHKANTTNLPFIHIMRRATDSSLSELDWLDKFGKYIDENHYVTDGWKKCLEVLGFEVKDVGLFLGSNNWTKTYLPEHE